MDADAFYSTLVQNSTYNPSSNVVDAIYPTLNENSVYDPAAFEQLYTSTAHREWINAAAYVAVLRTITEADLKHALKHMSSIDAHSISLPVLKGLLQNYQGETDPITIMKQL